MTGVQTLLRNLEFFALARELLETKAKAAKDKARAPYAGYPYGYLGPGAPPLFPSAANTKKKKSIRTGYATAAIGITWSECRDLFAMPGLGSVSHTGSQTALSSSSRFGFCPVTLPTPYGLPSLGWNFTPSV